MTLLSQKRLLSAVLWCSLYLVSGQDIHMPANEGYVERHVHAVSNAAQKYSKSSNIHEVQQEGNLRSALGSEMYADAIARARDLLTTSGLSADAAESSCQNDTARFLTALSASEMWAMRMFDSFGKPASGIFDGATSWLGSYDECMAVEAPGYSKVGNVTETVEPFNGQYCRAYLRYNQFKMTVNLAMCFPDSCNGEDVTAAAKQLIGLLPLPSTSFTFLYAYCQKKSLELSDTAIFVIVVCSVFAAVMVFASVYDIVSRCLSSSGLEKHKIAPTQPARYSSYNGYQNGHAHATEETPLDVDKKQLIGDYTNSVEHSAVVSHERGDVEKLAIGTGQQYGTVPSTPKPKQAEKSILARVLLSFSMISNGEKIISTNQPAGTLTAVNGIRFLSMTWVILGHTYAFGLGEVANVGSFYPEMLKRFTFQAVLNATVSVDTFFVLSGLLVSYLSLKEMKKRGGVLKFNWLMYYFHRFWRLTPPYMLFLMLYVPTVKYWSNGPLWSQTGLDKDECRDSWWHNLLYINNLYGMDKGCMGWSWYLANDMQFFVLSPIMLIPLFIHPILGSLACLALLLVNFISAGLISKHYDMTANMLLAPPGSKMMDKYYVTPWCRIGPYVVGFFTGYLLYITDCKVKMNKVLNLLGWAIATTVAMLVLYGLYKSDGTEKLGVETSALYNATARSAWGAAVAWVIFACATGNGGPVNKLLSWSAIIPLSRLTYCAYLVHPVVMDVYNMSRRTPMYWYDLEIIYLFVGNIVLSYAAAFIISLAFESPMMGLEKVLLRRSKNS